MKQPRLISQGSLSRILQGAEESRRRGDLQGWTDALERASRLSPANFGLLLDLGRAYGQRYNHAAAEATFEKAIRLSPRKTETTMHAGMQCREFGNPKMAEKYFRRAAEQKDVHPDVFLHLAELAERFRQVDEANQWLDRALHQRPDFIPALLAQAHLQQQAGRLEEAEAQLRKVIAKAEPALRVRAWYELGTVLDRQKRYDDAMAAFLEAKALQRPGATQHIHELTVIRSRLKELRESVTGDTLKRWFDARSELQPSHRITVLCGHPRSGTTLLEQVLDSHPDIVSAEETTIFLDEAYTPLALGQPANATLLSVLESAPIPAIQKSRAQYFRMMDLFLGNPVGQRLLIDKNPSFTFLPLALIRLFPEVKFLVALRDPRDVCLSCFMQYLPFNQASSAWLSLDTTIAEYIELMTMWRTIAPIMQNPGLEVRYEDMVEDLETVARKTLTFLDVPWDERVLRFNEHASQKLVRSPTYADVAKPVFKRAVGRWRNYQKYLEPHLARLDPLMQTLGYE